MTENAIVAEAWILLIEALDQVGNSEVGQYGTKSDTNRRRRTEANGIKGPRPFSLAGVGWVADWRLLGTNFA